MSNRDWLPIFAFIMLIHLQGQQVYSSHKKRQIYFVTNLFFRNFAFETYTNIPQTMNWIILIIARLCEVGFTFCLGRARNAAGTEWWLWIGGFIVISLLSMALLAKATETLPIGTAYPVWTGIGAVGTVLVGIIFFNEPTTTLRLFFITTLIISIIGLKALA